MEIIENPGDGNCLFRALGFRLDVDHLTLRREVAEFAYYNAKTSLMQETVEYWVKSNDYSCIHQYAQKISQNGVYGSALEIAIVSKLYKRRIVVWIPEEKGIRSIGVYEGKKPTIHLYYTTNHYRLLSFD